MDKRADGRDDQRRAVLQSALPNIAFDGWCAQVLDEAMADAQVPAAEALDLFPRGVSDLFEFASWSSDQQMLSGLAGTDLSSQRIREKIALAVRLRIESLADHREAVRKSLAFLAMPGNQLLGARAVGRTVDAMWRGIGDASTDFNFYTKRATLGAVYSSTVLFWLNDDSDGFAETWAFLDRRIENVMQFEKGKAQVKSLAAKLPNPIALAAALRYPSRF